MQHWTTSGQAQIVFYPVGVSLTSLFSSWMTFWEALYLLREESSCIEHCFTCALRVSFSSSNFCKFSFDCSPIKEQSPEKRCYPQTLVEAHSSFPHSQLHLRPAVSQAFSLSSPLAFLTFSPSSPAVWVPIASVARTAWLDSCLALYSWPWLVPDSPSHHLFFLFFFLSEWLNFLLQHLLPFFALFQLLPFLL